MRTADGLTADGRTICQSVCQSDFLSVGRSVGQSVGRSVGWLVGLCASIHTYDHVCRQTDTRQTACMHVFTDLKTERNKKRNLCNCFILTSQCCCTIDFPPILLSSNYIHRYIDTCVHSVCFNTCLSVSPFVGLSVHACCLFSYGHVFQPVCLSVCR